MDRMLDNTKSWKISKDVVLKPAVIEVQHGQQVEEFETRSTKVAIKLREKQTQLSMHRKTKTSPEVNMNDRSYEENQEAKQSDLGDSRSKSIDCNVTRSDQRIQDSEKAMLD